jgi:hypothetical protein
MICDRHYIRRCRQCRHDETISLPPLKKRIIYLDQFVISNIMKTLDPARSKDAKGGTTEFFQTLFKMLDRLSKLQLIICPHSPIHSFESIVDSRYEKLRAVFRHLSNGIGFHDAETIIHAQIMGAFRAWLDGKPYENQLSRDFALTGNPDVWQERFRIDTNYRLPGIADALSAARQATTVELHAVCDRWRTDPNFSFKQVFEEELVGYAKKILGEFGGYVRRFQAYRPEEGPPDIAVCFQPAAVSLVTRMLSAVESKFPNPDDRFACVLSFFSSDNFRSVPTVRISALFLATIAREVNSGRNPDNYPTGGIFHGIEAVAAYLPFCDAMFVDKEISHFARQGDLKKELSPNGRVFSLRANKRDAFIDYLKSIEADASTEHLRLVEEVYGPKWATPFEDLLSVVQGRDE